jgi:D-xylose transport system substrate-binding protein
MQTDGAGKAVALVVACLALGVVSACGSTASDASSDGADAKIAFLMPESQTLRYESKDRPAFVDKVTQLCSGCAVIYGNADGDPAKQQQQAEAALTNGAKVLVIDPANSASAVAIAARARARNVPVIAYDRLIDNTPLDYYISFDNVKVGRLQGQALADELRAQGKQGGPIVMLNGDPKTATARQFKQGASEVIGAGGVAVAKDYDTPDWSPSNAQREMDQAITALGKTGFAGVYAANDDLAGGAVASLKSAGIDASTRPLTGQDATLAGIQRIVSGEQSMTIYKAVAQEAQAAAELAVTLAKGGKPDSGTYSHTTFNGANNVPSLLLEPIAVTRNNVKDTVLKDGYWTVSDICTANYAQNCAQLGIKL